MKSTKTMLFGILIVLVGLSLTTGFAQMATLQIGLSVDIIQVLPLTAFSIILVGFLIGLFGLIRKEE